MVDHSEQDNTIYGQLFHNLDFQITCIFLETIVLNMLYINICKLHFSDDDDDDDGDDDDNN